MSERESLFQVSGRWPTSPSSDVSERRISHTNVARIQLVLSPLLLLILLLIDLIQSVDLGARRFGEAMWWRLCDEARWLYRDVYRVARYGSVWDD